MTTVKEFREFGKEMIDFVADYMENIRDQKVLTDVKPGYLQHLMPAQAPESPEKYKEIFEDINKLIIPGIRSFQHPNFHAYFNQGNGYPSIVAEILSASLGGNGFTWNTSPAYTELEMHMMDWLAKLLNLPEMFLFSHEGPGGGVIQGTASESTLLALLAARAEYGKLTGDSKYNFEKLVGYASDQSHSSVERAGMLAGVTIRCLETDSNYSLRGDTLKEAIKKDKKAGLIPCFCTATLGTTTSCAFDNLEEIGLVCQQEDLWLHVDAAYAGSAFICEEYTYLMKGMQMVDSFNFNPHKLLLVLYHCSALWFKDSSKFTKAFNVDPVYLTYENNTCIPDYRHWQIPLEKRFRSLKVWFTLRLYGKSGLQEHIRQHVSLAKEFEKLVRNNENVEIVAPVILGLVCFRFIGSNEINQLLYNNIDREGKIHLTPATLNGKYVIRFSIHDGNRSDDIKYAYEVIKEHVANLKNRNDM